MHNPLILSRDQVRRVDEQAIRQYALSGIVLMENAGRGAAQIVDAHYGPRGRAFIVCGVGNNGGDGLVIARHLHNTGWSVQVLIAGSPSAMSPDCAANDRIIEAMAMVRLIAPDAASQCAACTAMERDTVVLDALLGTGFQGQVRPTTAALIDRINSAPRRALVAIDVPSGLDCDTGLPGGVAIRADHTITFVAAKPGFLTDSGRQYAGRCDVVDIGAPRELIEQIAGVAKR